MKSGSGAFDVDDFVARLITYMGGRKPVSPARDGDEDESEYDAGGAPLDWERIARRALAKSRRVPAMDFMCVFSSVGYVGPYHRWLSCKPSFRFRRFVLTGWHIAFLLWPIVWHVILMPRD